MSRIFETHPLPWRLSNVVKPVTRQNGYGYSNAVQDSVTTIIDANGKEVQCQNNVDFLRNVVEITDKLTTGQRKKLGQNARSTKLFAVRNKQTGAYIGAGTNLLQYAKLWRTHTRADKNCKRLNSNAGGVYEVVEVKMSAG